MLDTLAPSPFDLASDVAYRPWREQKLRHRARDAGELLVDLGDPRHLNTPDRARLLERIARHGVAVYRSPRTEDDPTLPRALGVQLGLLRLDANWLADEDGLSRIAVAAGGAAGAGRTGGTGGTGGTRGEFIPYTDHAIGWHTDGYYHPEARRILAMILHCVRPAAVGGETTLLDHELVYIALRDESPALVRALMHPKAMTIPAREDDGGVARAAQSGPVFSVVEGPAGPQLHMRYTARTRSIEWRDDALTREAAARLARMMDGELGGILHLTLQPGMGLVGHNVLHARSAFRDDPRAPRLLYRARYLDAVTGSATRGAGVPRDAPAPGPAAGATEGAWRIG
ncbi:MAG: TauD/TfdA family dioxygenase [Rubrivivax sp.]|nr:TauD/TfdA family dioxygenase [Rubrivivax sp.]